ncbi:MAG: endonuclease [Bacteroidaceae bacterium]|nr:endonuclease [Bacteroidaceae bacterium]
MKLRISSIFFLLTLFVTASFAQKDYYTSIDGVKGGATLKTALYNLIKEHKKIPYGPGSEKTWGAFYTTDAVVENGQRRVLDMYSNEKRYFGSKGTAIDGMNIEHSVAKSWWGGTNNNAYCDLHHLNPSDQPANSQKSNYPLGELTSVKWNNGVAFVGKANIDGESVNAFEPCDEYKGDFARTYMYMFTCYQDLTWKYTWMNYDKSTYPTLKPWAVELLLKWHKQDPVSEKEVNRNNAVYAVQGNRNPFVDYPQLAHYVWGDSVDYVFHLTGDVELGTGGDNGGNDDNNGDSGNTEITTIDNIIEGASAIIKGTVVATNARSFLVEDETGIVLVYLNKAPNVVIGEEVTVNGTVSTYGGLLQFPEASVVTKTGKSTSVKYPVATEFDGAAMDGYISSPDIIFVKYTGQLTINGSYYNVSVADATAATGSIAYPVAGLVTVASGEEITVIGYATGVSSNKYVNTMTLYAGTPSGAAEWEKNNCLGSGDDTENPGTVPSDGKFRLLTDASLLVVGDRLLIASAEQGVVAGNITSSYLSKVAVAVNDNEIENVPEGATVFTLGGEEGAWTLANPDGQLLGATNTKKLAWDNGSTTWTIDVDDSNAAIIYNTTENYGRMLYNVTSPRFNTYTSNLSATMILPEIYRQAVNTEDDEDVSTVDELIYFDEDAMQDKIIHDLAGRRIYKITAPGIYIINGQKVIK